MGSSEMISSVSFISFSRVESFYISIIQSFYIFNPPVDEEAVQVLGKSKNWLEGLFETARVLSGNHFWPFE